MQSEYRFIEIGLFGNNLPWRQQIVLWTALSLWLGYLTGMTALIGNCFADDPPLSRISAILALPILSAAFIAAILGLRIVSHRWQPRLKK